VIFSVPGLDVVAAVVPAVVGVAREMACARSENMRVTSADC